VAKEQHRALPLVQIGHAAARYLHKMLHVISCCQLPMMRRQCKSP
jgi:hypothetical protein